MNALLSIYTYKMLSAIAIVDNKYGIAQNGIIPKQMNIRSDKKIFKQITTRCIINEVIMGHNTWDSLPYKLPNRINTVIATNPVAPRPTLQATQPSAPDRIYTSPEEFIQTLSGTDYYRTNYVVIGGEMIYEWFLKNAMISTFYLVMVDVDYGCDQFIRPHHFDNFKIVNIECIDNIKLIEYRYVNHQERCLLDIIKQILLDGSRSIDRTGTGTIRTFGHRLEFNLSSFPLMTARHHPLRMIFEELMWILRGQTQTTILNDKNIPIWNANSTAEFIARQNLVIDLPAGDIGRSYGYNMRIYDETNPCDQLVDVLNLLKNNPDSRRIIINLWNPCNVNKSALPPCLCWYQFFVRTASDHTYLDCQAMNRSSDIVVAGGWNIATAALMTYILAQCCGYKPGKLIWLTGDTHIYLNNIEAADMLMSRTTNVFPKLYINKKLNTPDDILALQYADIRLVNYHPGSKIKMKMNT